MPGQYRDSLAEAVQRLEAAYATTRERLAAELAQTGSNGYYCPEEMRDANGRHILLDALTAIVNARATLASVPAACPETAGHSSNGDTE